ncbi:MAG: hypothetical protein E7313_05260 [Clostridiales bacterium]|nr:hypothetical protein [Clostridiales bacterium]
MEDLNGVLYALQGASRLDKIVKIGAAIVANDDERILKYFKLKDDLILKECSSLKEYDEMLEHKNKLLQELRDILLLQQKMLLQGKDIELYGLIKKAKSLNGYGTSTYIHSTKELLKRQLDQKTEKQQIKDSLCVFDFVEHSKYKIAIFTSSFEDSSIFEIPPGLYNPKNWENAYVDIDENTTFVLAKQINQVSVFTHKFWLNRIFNQNGLIHMIG